MFDDYFWCLGKDNFIVWSVHGISTTNMPWMSTVRVRFISDGSKTSPRRNTLKRRPSWLPARQKKSFPRLIRNNDCKVLLLIVIYSFATTIKKPPTSIYINILYTVLEAVSSVYMPYTVYLPLIVVDRESDYIL